MVLLRMTDRMLCCSATKIKWALFPSAEDMVHNPSVTRVPGAIARFGHGLADPLPEPPWEKRLHWPITY
jgi:hypothetical protein